jgi:16S rRNA (adenine1518-N6/adenine1519-N6)-dimethyltransferase
MSKRDGPHRGTSAHSFGRGSTPHLRAKRSLGQNFLLDDNIARKIVRAIDPGPADLLLEIGPGEGALTRHLAPAVGRLVAIDLDRRVIERMHALFPDGEVEIIEQDFLETDLPAIADRLGGLLRVAGNIPYNITTPILFHVLDHRQCVRDLTIMMQREVARRLVAEPGTKEYGILAVLTGMFAQPELLFDVGPAAFIPRPKVTSTVVRLAMRHEPRAPVADEMFFRTLVRSVFGTRRKMLRHSLRTFAARAGRTLPETFQRPERPEELSIERLAELSNDLYAWFQHERAS